MMRSTFRLAGILVAVTWLFLVTFGYYIVHQPFGGENVLAILNALGDLLVAGALIALAAAGGIDTRLVNWRNTRNNMGC